MLALAVQAHGNGWEETIGWTNPYPLSHQSGNRGLDSPPAKGRRQLDSSLMLYGR